MRSLLFGVKVAVGHALEGYLLFSQRKCRMLPVGTQNGSFQPMRVGEDFL
jgi:hypothetical protein